jgi:nicotinate-nucleotide adenylyltransferase
MSAIGIFGGSFNPIHAAHLILAERARAERDLQKVLFIPAGSPPHKPPRPLAPAEHRLRMVELAVRDNPAFEADPIELERRGPSYTLRTVRELQERYAGQTRLFLIVGGDSVHELPTWWRADELVREIELVALRRPGYELGEDLRRLAGHYGGDWARRTRELAVEAPLLEISATDIRRRVAEGRTIRYLVPEPVRAYIGEHGLYGAAP